MPSPSQLPPPSPPPPPGSLPSPPSPSPPACVDEDARMCQREVITFDDKIGKCTTERFIVACQLTCGHCTVPSPLPSPSPSPPLAPSPSPPPPPGSLPSPPSPSPPACVDKDARIC